MDLFEDIPHESEYSDDKVRNEEVMAWRGLQECLAHENARRTAIR